MNQSRSGGLLYPLINTKLSNGTEWATQKGIRAIAWGRRSLIRIDKEITSFSPLLDPYVDGAQKGLRAELPLA